MNENRPCPIWGTPTKPDEFLRGFGQNVDSPRAGGKYFVDRRAVRMVEKLDVREKARLTTWMIEQRRLGVERPEIRWNNLWDYSEKLDKIVFKITQRLDLTVHARADELLKYIQKKTPNIGKEYVYWKGIHDQTMEMLAYTESISEEEELRYLLNYLIKQGWLELASGAGGVDAKHVTITVAGYARLAELENVKTDSSRVFVAMWFDKSLDSVYDEAISPAIKNMGYEAIRVDRRHHLDKIDDQIIAEIRRSRFIIADFTQGGGGARGGVYYEAGFAHGLNIPVIFTCREDMINHLHFDTRQYPHVVWNSPEELKMQLEDRIGAVIGDGPLKNRNLHA